MWVLPGDWSGLLDQVNTDTLNLSQDDWFDSWQQGDWNAVLTPRITTAVVQAETHDEDEDDDHHHHQRDDSNMRSSPIQELIAALQHRRHRRRRMFIRSVYLGYYFLSAVRQEDQFRLFETIFACLPTLETLHIIGSPRSRSSSSNSNRSSGGSGGYKNNSSHSKSRRRAGAASEAAVEAVVMTGFVNALDLTACRHTNLRDLRISGLRLSSPAETRQFATFLTSQRDTVEILRLSELSVSYDSRSRTAYDTLNDEAAAVLPEQEVEDGLLDPIFAAMTRLHHIDKIGIDTVIRRGSSKTTTALIGPRALEAVLRAEKRRVCLRGLELDGRHLIVISAYYAVASSSVSSSSATEWLDLSDNDSIDANCLHDVLLSMLNRKNFDVQMKVTDKLLQAKLDLVVKMNWLGRRSFLTTKSSSASSSSLVQGRNTTEDGVNGNDNNGDGLFVSRHRWLDWLSVLCRNPEPWSLGAIWYTLLEMPQYVNA